MNKEKEQLNIDYVICPYCNAKYKNLAHHFKSAHNTSTAEVRKEFPNVQVQAQKSIKSATRNSGQHMKKPEYKKRASERLKGDKNPNHTSNTTEEQRQSVSPFSKGFKKYASEEDRQEFLNNIDWTQRLTNTQLQWWIDLCNGDKEMAEKLFKERQKTTTLEKFQEKYGKEKGKKRFDERNKRWKKSLQENFEKYGDGRSPSSKFANSIIKELCDYLNIDIPKKEKWIFSKSLQRAFSYDFTYNKKIIEFNGTYWHMDSKIYDQNDFNKTKNKYASEIWKDDENKILEAKKHGYEVLTIWENEWMNNPEQTINKCIDFLEN